MFPPGGSVPVNVTLCSLALVNVHVTVPPGAIATVTGLNVSLVVAVTAAVLGFGPPPPPVTVTVTCPDCTPSDVALICDVPAATPVAVTALPLVAERETFVWSEVVQLTVRDKGLP